MIKEGLYPITQAHIDADEEQRYHNNNPVTRALRDAFGQSTGICVWPIHKCVTINQEDIMTSGIFDDWYENYSRGKTIKPCFIKIYKQDPEENDEHFWIGIEETNT